jgi:hypothetical protein
MLSAFSLLLCWGSWLPALAGEPENPHVPAVVEKNPIEETQALVQKQLLQRVSLDFVETPLHDVANGLSEQLIVQIVIDQKRLEEAGLTLDMLITFQVRNITGKSALRLMLEKHGLGYVLRDEVLLITSQEMAEAEQIVRVHNVRDLLEQLPVKSIVAPPVAPGALSAEPENSLVTLVMQTIDPHSWSPNGGEGMIQELGGLLVVSNNQRVHDNLESLLVKLRDAASKRVNAGGK